jgi:hypothetical protein
MRAWKAPAALCGGLLLFCCGGDPAAPADGEGAAPAAEAADNSPPVIDEVALSPARPRPGESVEARVIAHDPEGDAISLDYHWRAGGRTVESAEGQPSLHVQGMPRETSIQVEVVARDAHGESAPETAVARVGNLPPTIVQVVMQPLGEVSAGNDVTASPRATDPEGASVEYRYRWRVNGETVPVDGPTLPASLLKRGDSIELEVVASDGSEDSEPLVSPPIQVVNAAPRIVSRPGPIGPDGIFLYPVKVEDADGDHIFRFKLAKGPKGMTIGFDDGLLRWDPPADAAGSHQVEIEVEDRFGGHTSQRFALELSYETEQPAAAAPAKHAPEAAPES